MAMLCDLAEAGKASTAVIRAWAKGSMKSMFQL